MISLFCAHFPLFLRGIYITLILMSASLALGLGLAILMTACRFFAVRLLTPMVNALVFFICGTPLLVQLFLVYYGASQFECLRHSFLWLFFREPMACAIIALAFNTACYTTVLLTGAIHSVPKNEIAACEALGMSKWLAFRRIIFPRAFRLALPAYSNEVVIMLKSTSLASTITLLDLMGVTQQLIAETYETMPLYLVAGVIYLVLNMLINKIVKWLTTK